MRRIALINQKGGVGKTTTAVNLGAALAAEGRSVVVVDLDPQANLSLHLGLSQERPSSYSVLVDGTALGAALQPTGTPGFRAVRSDLDLCAAELELAAAMGRETILREAVATWVEEEKGGPDYLLFDCPPSLGLLSVNALAASDEVFLVVQTEFFALQGLSRLVEVVQLLRRRLHPALEVTGIVPCLYDSRLKLAREVLADLRRTFSGLVFRQAIGCNVKLAEASSFAKTVFQYAPDSNGARDYLALAREVIAQETVGAESAPEEEAAPEKETGDKVLTPAPRAQAEAAVEPAPEPAAEER